MVPEQPEREQFSLFHPDTKLFSEMNTIGMLVKNLKYGTHHVQKFDKTEKQEISQSS